MRNNLLNYIGSILDAHTGLPAGEGREVLHAPKMKTRTGRGVSLARFFSPVASPQSPNQHCTHVHLEVKWRGSGSGSYQWVLVIEQPPLLGIQGKPPFLERFSLLQKRGPCSRASQSRGAQRSEGQPWLVLQSDTPMPLSSKGSAHLLSTPVSFTLLPSGAAVGWKRHFPLFQAVDEKSQKKKVEEVRSGYCSAMRKALALAKF